MNTMIMRTKIMIVLLKNQAIMMTFIRMKSTGKIIRCIGNLKIRRLGMRMADTTKMKKFKICVNKVPEVSQLVLQDKSMKLIMIKR